MWVYVYQSTQAETKDAEITDSVTGNKVPIYDGQLLLKDANDIAKFYTWDRTRSRWATIKAINASFSEYWSTISIWTGTATGSMQEIIRRIHHHNCDQYSICTPDFGSNYSLRSDVKVYNEAGTLNSTISAPNKISFGQGYGYTKDSSLPASATGVGVRNSGYTPTSGSPYTYGAANVRYASINFTLHPLNYAINTA